MPSSPAEYEAVIAAMETTMREQRCENNAMRARLESLEARERARFAADARLGVEACVAAVEGGDGATTLALVAPVSPVPSTAPIETIETSDLSDDPDNIESARVRRVVREQRARALKKDGP